MNKLNSYKISLVCTSIGIFFLIVYLTCQIIYQTENWKYFDIDFTPGNNEAISAYGTLIGGILAFLSILFVVYGLLDQRQQIINEKIVKDNEDEIELLYKIKLLSSFCKSAIDNIKIQGEKLKDFYISEKEFPSKINRIYFSTNKNFSRVIELDALSIYKAINLNFKDDENRENIFLDVYSIFDFYSANLNELQDNFKIQLNTKYDKLERIGFDLDEFNKNCKNYIDEYNINLGEKYKSYPWTILINEFATKYSLQLKQAEIEKEIDFRNISDNLLQPFIKNGNLISERIGIDIYRSENLVKIAIDIRKSIYRIEKQSVGYAEDIEKQYKKYYIENNENLIKLNNYKQKFDNLQNKIKK